ncbi:MAG: ADP-glyceromanno-heptose 6-epimerase [SAR86 cluster bacterium]|nr:ADP-glyceromanno-heptose 6-epimerase [SAR86 cluster bacterium]
MIIVTGCNGFIGSNLVSQLNKLGFNNIIGVDDLSKKKNLINIEHCEIEGLLDIEEFESNYLLKDKSFNDVNQIFHQGACTNTMEWDAEYMMKNNFSFSQQLLDFAERNSVSFIYASSASVYGGGKKFEEIRENENPINLYAFSKYLFDQLVRQKVKANKIQIVGLRYFNVYGPNESHKGQMASVAYHLHQQLKEGNDVKLFEGSGGFGPGEQRRDFIYVDDVVKVNLWFMNNPDVSGIFNVGTGKSQTFNEVAKAVIEWHGKGSITYIPFPKELIDSYQSFTEANIDRLRQAGYQEDFLDVQSGIKLYLDELQNWPKNAS